MTKKLRTVIIIAVAFLVLLIAYFAVVKPLTATEDTEEEEEIPELLPGEVLGNSNRILIFEHVEKAEMDSIEVHNQYGTYKFYRAEDDSFYIEGMETVTYDLEYFSSLVVSTGYTITLKRLDFDEVDSDLSVYGLAESDNPAWYEVVTLTGDKHKVYIGDAIPTAGGYYCRYEGRDAVYILDTSLASTVLADIHTLITPILAWPISSSDYYYVDDFMIIKNGEMYVWIDMLTAEENGTDLPSYEMKYPTGYEVDLTTYSTFLETFGEFVGDKCVAAGPDELENLSAEWLKETYGIDVENPYYELTYNVNDVETIMIFSEPDEDENMYVYSTVYGLVAQISVSNASFVNWGLLSFIDSGVFGDNINDVAKMEIKGSLDETNTKGEAIDVDESFVLDGEDQTILIYENGSDEAYDSDDLKNFRQLYKSILSIKIEDYVDEGYEAKAKLIAEFTVTMDSGEVKEYKFYAYSTRRCYYTLNGVGEFYVLRTSVEKMLRDTDRMIIGDLIVSDNKD